MGHAKISDREQREKHFGGETPCRMTGVRKKYDQEFKKNAVKLSYVSPKTISELCEYLGYQTACCITGGSGTRRRGTRREVRRWKRKSRRSAWRTQN